MILSIIKKEWLKIRFIICILIAISFSFIMHFWYNLNFSFSTAEPESMMWYRFTQLQQKPYEYLAYIFYSIALSISLFQFIPEQIKNRVKLMAHLPISMSTSLFLHLFIGIFYIFVVSVLNVFVLFFILSNHYPAEIIHIFLGDMGFYFLGSVLLYIGISSAIIDKNQKVSALKLIVTLYFIFVFHKNVFTYMDLAWMGITAVMFFVALDSFYSIKEQRIQNIIFKFFLLLSLSVVVFFSYNLYEKKYKQDFNEYYIFYSPILKDFVYKKDLKKHKFEYGIKDKQIFDQSTYESYLPLTYWRNLDIQKKLSIKIDEESFDKSMIKNSRLSFSYSPKFLKKKETKIYPLINPNSKIGMIRFPEEMMVLKNNQIKIYSYDEKVDKNLTQELQKLFTSKKVNFPISDMWGKTTNLKPFDLGYFFLDAKNKLFKLNRANDALFLKELNYPKNIDIQFIKISENKQQKLAGYAIDSKNRFYVIDYNTFKFRQVNLKNFDYKTMRLQLISNAKYYLLRYTNEDQYYAVVFDKEFKKLDETIFQ